VRRYIFISVALLLSLLAGCASTSGDNLSPDSLRSIYIVRRGWHTGIVIAVQDWPNRNWALLADFPSVEYLEFGWGDERFYQAEPETFWLGVRAALWPTSSVIHTIGLREPVAVKAQAAEVVQLSIPAAQLREIASAIEMEFAGTDPEPTGHMLKSAPAPNRFYKARRSFYFPRMCNWWVAKRLQQAGCPVQAWTVITASRTMNEARECASRPMQ
jgi:uncharacterized protein (TIGR02117 family)